MKNKSDVFDSDRFGMLVGMELMDGFKKSRMIAAALAGIFVLVAVVEYFTCMTMRSPDRNALISAFMIVFAFYLPSGLYSMVNDSKHGIWYMTLPVSAVEKFLSMILVAVVVLPLTFEVAMYLLDNAIAAVSGGKGFVGSSVGRGIYSVGDIAEDFLNVVLLQSVFIWGNVFFRKRKIVATLLVLAVFHILVFGIMQLCGLTMADIVDSKKGLFTVLMLCYKYLIPIVLYITAFLRLKRTC